mmetsp:Transcript_25850/g.4365  ORF Transcript_25850/g.4365 Transcript_25850/m.4365 type:complete len:93 (+) Transcript_25850:1741-2019(+)
MIITDGSIAELIENFYHLGENYTFYCDIISYEESFITGNVSDVWIKPKIYMNSQPAPLEILKDFNATIIFDCYETGKTTLYFDDLVFEGGYY